MLPFLKNRRVPGLIVEHRKPDADRDIAPEDNDSAIESAAEDLLRAVESRDKKMVAAALRAAFEILDSEPHVEGEHLNEGESE